MAFLRLGANINGRETDFSVELVADNLRKGGSLEEFFVLFDVG